MAHSKKFTVFSFPGSQWAQVVHLTLAQKQVPRGDYDVQNIDLIAAANFNPEYLAINPEGTVPSVTFPGLSKPLTQSRDILRYIDETYGPTSLSLEEDRVKSAPILTLVHSEQLNTNLILLQARDHNELLNKRRSMWNNFLINRQAKLEHEASVDSTNPFYQKKSVENSALHNVYIQSTSDNDPISFFEETHDAYRVFANGMEQLEKLIKLPYATGRVMNEADFHIVPWLAHAMWGAGTKPSDILDMETLERLIQKSAPDFHIGDKTRKWWSNMSATEAFKAVYPELH